MKRIQLSKRLFTLTEYIKPYRYLVDVGTDHCFVPIFMIQNNLIDYAIATDINEGPMLEAKQNVSSYALAKQIDVRLGNGLDSLNEEDLVDVILIAGMGGRLIVDILDRDKVILRRNKRLVLQGNNHVAELRKWLQGHQYKIINEEIVYDEGLYYEIVVAEPTNEAIEYNKQEIQFGPVLLTKRTTEFINHWQARLNHYQLILNQLPTHHNDYPDVFAKKNQIEAMLNQSD